MKTRTIDLIKKVVDYLETTRKEEGIVRGYTIIDIAYATNLDRTSLGRMLPEMTQLGLICAIKIKEKIYYY